MQTNTSSGWIANLIRPSDLARMRQISETFLAGPRSAWSMATFETPDSSYAKRSTRFVPKPIRSGNCAWPTMLRHQTLVRKYLEEYRPLDERIKVVYRYENGHIARATNSALEMATGEFVGFLDHDDILSPDALFEIALAINRFPDVDMLYSDEDKIDETGLYCEPHFKPDWSPDSFLSRMYTCHFGVYRRALVEALGGFRAEFSGSQDYDFVLRLTERTSRSIIFRAYSTIGGGTQLNGRSPEQQTVRVPECASGAMPKHSNGGASRGLVSEREDYPASTSCATRSATARRVALLFRPAIRPGSRPLPVVTFREDCLRDLEYSHRRQRKPEKAACDFCRWTKGSPYTSATLRCSLQLLQDQ